MKTKLLTITILILFILMVFPLNALASTIYVVDGFNTDLSKVGYLKYNGYTDRGYSYSWVDNPNYEIEAPASSNLINLVMVYASSETNTLAMYEIYETLYNDNTEETYRTLYADSILTIPLVGDAATAFANHNLSTEVVLININSIRFDSNKTDSIFNNYIYSTSPIINYGVYNNKPAFAGMTSSKVSAILNQNKDLTSMNPFYSLPKISISPSGYFGNEPRDINIATTSAKFVEVYLVNGYGEQYKLDSYNVYNLAGVNTVKISKENINWSLFTDFDDGVNKIKVIAYDMNYDPSPMINNVFVEKSANIMWTMKIPGGDGNEPLPEEIEIESPVPVPDPDPDFMIDDYIVAPVDIPLSSSENILTVKYVVKAPGTIDDFEIPYIFTTSNKTTETFTARAPYSVIQYDSDHVGFYVDTTIRLKPNSLNNFTIRVKKNYAVGFTLAQAKYVINSSFIPGSDVEVYDPETGVIDTDLTVKSALKTFLNFVSDLGDYLNSMAIIFTWLPPQIYALIVVALTLGIVLRVVGRP